MDHTRDVGTARQPGQAPRGRVNVVTGGSFGRFEVHDLSEDEKCTVRPEQALGRGQSTLGLGRSVHTDQHPQSSLCRRPLRWRPSQPERSQSGAPLYAFQGDRHKQRSQHHGDQSPHRIVSVSRHPQPGHQSYDNPPDDQYDDDCCGHCTNCSSRTAATAGLSDQAHRDFGPFPPGAPARTEAEDPLAASRLRP